MLLFAAAIHLGDRPPHRVGDLVAVEDHATAGVAGGAARGLDERALAPQEPLLVGVEDGDERHLGQVQSFTQQVDAHEHVEVGEAQAAQDLHALQRVDVAVQVAHAHTHLAEVVGEVLGHALGERGD